MTACYASNHPLWTGNCANISSGSEAGSFHLFLSHKRNDPVSNPLDWFDCFPTFIIPLVMKELHQTASPYSTLTGNCVGCMPALIIIENEEQTMSERPSGVVDVCSRMEMMKVGKQSNQPSDCSLDRFFCGIRRDGTIPPRIRMKY